jgi:ABC-type multidrug transport system fused ATPase/permease subunit
MVFRNLIAEYLAPRILSGLPWHWPNMRTVVQKHLFIFLLLLFMGTIFSVVGGLVIWFTADGLIFGMVFLLAGLAIIGFAFVSTYSSCLYYYQQSLLKQYGRSVEGIVINKVRDEFIDKNNTLDDEDDVIETNLSIQYRFEQLGKSYESESFLSDLALFDAIEVGMQVPIIVMKDHPNITRLQTKKLKKQLNVSAKNTTPNNVSISDSLMEDE